MKDRRKEIDYVSWLDSDGDKKIKKPPRIKSEIKSCFWQKTPCLSLNDENIKRHKEHKSGTFNPKTVCLPEKESSKKQNDMSSSNSICEMKIRRVMDLEYCKILYGNKDERIVLVGRWASIEYKEGRSIRVVRCKCCKFADDDFSKKYKDLILPRDEFNHTVFVDDFHNWILVDDAIISTTSFLTSISCINKPLILQKIADVSFVYQNASMIVGTAVHFLLQKSISAKNTSITFFSEQLKIFITNNLIGLYISGIDEKILKNEVLKHIKPIVNLTQSNSDLSLPEYSIVSKEYSLKGQIDCLAGKKVIELKTGKHQAVEHRGQALLYTLMVAETLRSEDLFTPVLFYSATSTSVPVEIKHTEIRELLVTRASVSFHSSITPCRCPETELCGVYNRIMCTNDFPFLKRHIEHLIEQEEKQEFARVQILPASEDAHGQYTINFTDYKEIEDIPGCRIKVGEKLGVYSEAQNFICEGIVRKITKNTVYVEFYKKSKIEGTFFASTGNSFGLFSSFVLFSIVEIGYLMCSNRETRGLLNLTEDNSVSFDENEVFDDSSENSSMSISLNSIDIQDFSMTKSEEKEKTEEFKLNNLYFVKNIPREAVQLEDTQNLYIPSSSSCISSIPIPHMFKTEYMKLNADQRGALLRSLNCESFHIIHGLPGTGKSTLIALLIRILIYYKHKILLVCFTHMAGENLLKKLKSVNSYKANGRGASDFFREKGITTVCGIKKYFSTVDLVVSTCYGFRDPVFRERTFDFCIIDEGSQVELFLGLIPIYLSRKFVIVGDHLQISPIGGSGRSIFEQALKIDPTFSVLKTQYRMCPEIMKLSNTLFYNNMMQCGNLDVTAGNVKVVDTNVYDIRQYVSQLYNCTVLCYFNFQVEFLSEVAPILKITTIDKFQGSEDDEIVIVFDPITNGECQKSLKRLNVALTRARKSLVLLGNVAEMKSIPIFKSLLEMII